MEISVQGWKASPSDWEAVRKIPKADLPALTDEQKEVARKLGLAEEDYARSALAGERTQNALLIKTEMFARLLEKKIHELGLKATVENVVLRILEDRFDVALRMDGIRLPLRIKEDIVDDLFEAGSAEAEEKLSRILKATLGVREHQ
jgi:hypothetical protein